MTGCSYRRAQTREPIATLYSTAVSSLLHADTPRDLLPASNEPPLQPGAKLLLPPVKLQRSGGRCVRDRLRAAAVA